MQAFIEWAILGAWLICVVICFLKGKKWAALASIVAWIIDDIPIAGMYWHHLITQPLLWFPLVGAVRLGRPDSIWSHRFYGLEKLKRSCRRFYPREMEAQESLKDWQIIADSLSKAGWTWGCTQRVDSDGKTIFVADARHPNGKHFVVRAEDNFTAFLELERQIRTDYGSTPPSIPLQTPSPSPGVLASHPKMPRARPLYATAVAGIIIVALGVAVRQFVDSKAMRLSRDMSPATSRFESPQPEPQIKKAVTVQPVEPEVRKAIPVKHTERIRKFAEENIAAEIAGDYSRMVDLRYPNIVELSGGREKVMNLLRQERKDLLAKGIAIAGAEASEPTQVATGRDKEFAIVPVTLRLKGPKGTPLIHAKSFTSRFRQTVATHGRSLKALI